MYEVGKHCRVDVLFFFCDFALQSFLFLVLLPNKLSNRCQPGIWNCFLARVVVYRTLLHQTWTDYYETYCFGFCLTSRSSSGISAGCRLGHHVYLSKNIREIQVWALLGDDSRRSAIKYAYLYLYLYRPSCQQSISKSQFDMKRDTRYPLSPRADSGLQITSEEHC